MTQNFQVRLSMNQAAVVKSGLILKQGDFGMNLEIEVLNFDTSNTTPQIVFRKPMGAVESTSVTKSGNVYTYTLRGTELDTPGKVICDLKLKNSTTQRISTASFSFEVVADTLDGLAEEASSYSDTIAQIIDGYEADIEEISEEVDGFSEALKRDIDNVTQELRTGKTSYLFDKFEHGNITSAGVDGASSEALFPISIRSVGYQSVAVGTVTVKPNGFYVGIWKYDAQHNLVSKKTWIINDEAYTFEVGYFYRICIVDYVNQQPSDLSWQYDVKLEYTPTNAVIDSIENQMADIISTFDNVPLGQDTITEEKSQIAPYNDFNTAPINSILLYVSALTNVLHVPEELSSRGGLLLTVNNLNTSYSGAFQLLVGQRNILAYRNNWSGSWRDWVVVSNDEPEPIDVEANHYTNLSMFEKIGVIGDSYASGTIYNSQGEYRTNYALSWPQNLARQCGITATNYSAGGLSTRTWLVNDVVGLPKLLSDDPLNLYMYSLGINDGRIQEPGYLGTSADVHADYTQNPDTFYGNYARIVAQTIAHAPKAKHIMICMDETSATRENFNVAIRYVANYYNIPVIEQDDSFFDSDIYNYMISAHPTAAGCSGMAMAFNRLFVKCVKNNLEYFSDYNPLAD